MLSKDMVKRLRMNYRNGNIEQEHLQKLIALLSNNVFDESSMTGSKAKEQSEDQVGLRGRKIGQHSTVKVSSTSAKREQQQQRWQQQQRQRQQR